MNSPHSTEQDGESEVRNNQELFNLLYDTSLIVCDTRRLAKIWREETYALLEQVFAAELTRELEAILADWPRKKYSYVPDSNGFNAALDAARSVVAKRLQSKEKV